MTDTWKDALSAFRQQAGVEADGPPHDARPANALFITCSESPQVTRLLATLNPASIVQTLGGVTPSSADARFHLAVADTIEDAIRRRSVTHVIACGHAGCRGADDSNVFGLMKSLGIGQDDSQRHLLAQVGRLEDYLQAQPWGRDVEVAALWFDPAMGEIHGYHQTWQRFVPFSDVDFERWIDHVSRQNAAELAVPAL